MDTGIQASAHVPYDICLNIPDALYLIDPETSKIIWVNPAGYYDLAMTEDEVLHQSVLSLQRHVLTEEQWKSIADVIRQKKRFTFIGTHIRKDNTVFPVEIITSVINHEGRELFLSVARDISKRHLEEVALAGREKHIWSAINASADGVWDWNVTDNSVYFSPSLKRMLGYGPDEMLPLLETWKNNIHPADLPKVMQALEEHIKGTRERYEAVYRLKNRNDHYLWVQDIGCVSEQSEDGAALSVTGVVRSVTDRKTHELRLQELAAYDELTSLRNRRECMRIFDKQLEFAERSNQVLSILLFDLDFFKTINDKYGHLAGDQVLRELAALTRGHIRKSDYLFRWGGEEFMLICPNTEQHQARQLAEKLRQAIEKHRIHYQKSNLFVTASFGTATYPHNALTRDALTLSADSALYIAKSKGRNQVASAKTKTGHTILSPQA